MKEYINFCGELCEVVKRYTLTEEQMAEFDLYNKNRITFMTKNGEIDCADTFKTEKYEFDYPPFWISDVFCDFLKDKEGCEKIREFRLDIDKALCEIRDMIERDKSKRHLAIFYSVLEMLICEIDV